MTAAHLDLFADVGTDYARTFQYQKPDPLPVEVQTLVADDRIWFDGEAWRVDSVTPGPLGNLIVSLGSGTFWEPKPIAKPTDLVHKMTVVPIIEARAAFAPKLDSFSLEPPDTIELPTSIVGDSVQMTMSKVWLEGAQAAIDRNAGGPSQTVGVWDMIVDAGAGPFRIVEGLLTIIRSTSAATLVSP